MANKRASSAGVPSAALVELIDAPPERTPSEPRVTGARLLAAAVHTARAGAQKRARMASIATAAAAVVAAATVSLVIAGHARRSASVAISYEVQNAVLGARGLIATAESEAHVRFSEGTAMDVARGSRVSVRDVDSHGAHLTLDGGRVHLDVVHLPGARWFVEAGPFEVAVTGTSFTAEWWALDAKLQITMDRGSVEVSGPLSDGPIVLRSGQRLIALARERETIIGEPGEDDLGPPPSTVTAPPAPAVASVLAPELGTAAPPRLGPNGTPSTGAGSEPNWGVELSSGHSALIVEQVQQRGGERCLREASRAGLSAIADAARFERRFDLARKALLTERERFPGSAPTRDTAFLLGRVDEAEGNLPAAIAWYETYSREEPSGAYASETLGREMSLSQQIFGSTRALPLAREYVARFPDGSYAGAARSLLAQSH